jgi:hypothetical protein
MASLRSAGAESDGLASLGGRCAPLVVVEGSENDHGFA